MVSIFRLMGADDNGIIDPRGPLDWVNRDQMREFAERNGIKEITWDMPGDQMRFILKNLGIKDIGVPYQRLGTNTVVARAADNNPGVPTVSLEDLQKQQWEQRAKEREAAQKPLKKRGRPKKVVHGQPHTT